MRRAAVPRHGTLELIAQHIHAEPPPIADRCPDAAGPLAELVHALLAKDPEQRPASAAAVREALGGTGAAHGTGLLGRTADLALLERSLAAARAGHGAVVAVSGEPGTGKTRLARELADRAAPGATVTWGRCVELDGAPAFWPWAEVLRGLELPELPAEAHRIIPSLGEPAAPGTTTAEARFELFEAIAGVVRGAAAEHPLLVVIEDLQWADRSSLELLEHLAPLLARLAILVVVTFRAGEARDALRAIEHERVELRGLGLEDVGRFIAATVGRPARPDLVAAIHSPHRRHPVLRRRGAAHARPRGRARRGALTRRAAARARTQARDRRRRAPPRPAPARDRGGAAGRLRARARVPLGDPRRHVRLRRRQRRGGARRRRRRRARGRTGRRRRPLALRPRDRARRGRRRAPQAPPHVAAPRRGRGPGGALRARGRGRRRRARAALLRGRARRRGRARDHVRADRGRAGAARARLRRRRRPLRARGPPHAAARDRRPRDDLRAAAGARLRPHGSGADRGRAGGVRPRGGRRGALQHARAARARGARLRGVGPVRQGPSRGRAAAGTRPRPAAARGLGAARGGARAARRPPRSARRPGAPRGCCWPKGWRWRAASTTTSCW